MLDQADILLTTEFRSDRVIAIFLIAAVSVISFAVFIILREKKRCKALQAAATHLGLSFRPEKNPAISKRYDFIHGVKAERNDYAYNVMQGTAADGSPVCFFDHRFEVVDRNGKINRYYYALYTLTLPKSLPDLFIEPENIFDRFFQALGFDDINFESVEFSKRYEVRSPDKKFAYDVCNARTIDYLLRQENLTIQIISNVLAIFHEGRMKPDKVIPNYQHLQVIRSLMPNYLFTDHST